MICNNCLPRPEQLSRPLWLKIAIPDGPAVLDSLRWLPRKKGKLRFPSSMEKNSTVAISLSMKRGHAKIAVIEAVAVVVVVVTVAAVAEAAAAVVAAAVVMVVVAVAAAIVSLAGKNHLHGSYRSS